jgi:hypothetical protein
MDFSLVQLRAFSEKWKRYRLTDEDLQSLEQTLIERPEAGPVMRGTGGLRKVRFSPAGTAGGKSGALRICYAVFRQFSRIYLVTFFAKNDSDNLTAAERASAKSVLETIGGLLRGGQDP